jgi:PAS domain S-box-containing protein
VDSLKSYAEKAHKISTENDFEVLHAWSDIWLGIVDKHYVNKNDFLYNANEAFTLFEENNSFKGMVKSLNLIATAHKIFIDKFEIKHFFENALDILEEHPDTLLLMETLSNLAQFYHISNELSKADSIYKIVSNLNSVHNDIYINLINNARHAYTLRRIGKIDLAIELLEQNSFIVNNYKESALFPDTYSDLAFIFSEAGWFEDALKNINISINNKYASKFIKTHKHAYNIKVEILKKLNRFEEAIEVQDTAIKLGDQIQQKLELENLAMQRSNSSIEAKSKLQQSYLMAAIVSSILLLIIVVTLVRMNQQKNGYTKDLQERIKEKTKHLSENNRQLLDEIQSRKQAEKINKLNEKRLQSLFKVSAYQAKCVQDLLDYALHEAIELTKSKIGFIYKYNEQTKEFTLNSWSKEVMSECKVVNPQTLYHLEKTGIWGEAVRQRKEIVVNEFSAPHPHKKGLPEGHVKLNKFLTLPVFRNGEIVATVGVANKKSDYSDLDVNLLKLFMDQVWSIVERKQIEEKLVSSELKYRSLYENITAGFVIYELVNDESGNAADFKYIEVNKTFEKLYLQKAEDIQGKFASELYNKPRKEILENLAEVAKSGKPKNFSYYSYTTDKYIDAWLFKSSGNYIGGILNDITEQRVAEMALKDSETKYRLLFENMTAGFALHEMIYDNNGKAIDYRYLEVNPAFERLTGVKAEDLIGKTVKEVMPKTEDYWIEKAEKVAKTGESFEFENYAKELGRHYNTFLFRPRRDHFAIVFTDVTEKKQFQEKIMQMNNKLNEAVDTKDKFFSIIAHDLRNPMHGLMSISQMLNDDYDDLEHEERKQLIKSLYSSGKNTFKLLENLLNWSRLQTGKMDYNPTSINIYALIHKAIKPLNEIAKKKSLSIIASADPELFIEADENILETVLRNLISNAIKFSYPNSTIEVTSQLNCEFVYIKVRDFGTGIEEQMMDKLFKPGKNSSRNGTNKERGTGLGLLLCHDMIELHNGKIEVESKVGEGSTFNVALPI